MKLNQLIHQTVCVLGMGAEGTDTLKFLLKHCKPAQIAVADQKKLETLSKTTQQLIKSQPAITSHLGPNYLNKVNQYDTLIRSPGINPYHPPLNQPNIKAKTNSATNIFFANTTTKTIGVTGTKGKSTTASLIHQLLTHLKIKSALIGNIGNPMLTTLLESPPAVFILELSSHQLIDANASPEIAICLDIFPEHLDYYDSLDQYVNAKKNITAHQSKTDYYIYNPHHTYPAQFAKRTPAQKITYGIEPSEMVLLKDNNINITQSTNTQTINLNHFPLKGHHNRLNLAAAVAATIPFSVDLAELQAAITSLSPLDHRLELIGTFKGITFYNDSLATVPQATMAAIQALAPKLHTLIIGGYDRGIDQTLLVDAIKKYQVNTVIAMPDTGHQIADMLEKNGDHTVIKLDNLNQAVAAAFTHTPPESICCISPAAASFNQFKDYKERGNRFKQLVKTHGTP